MQQTRPKHTQARKKVDLFQNPQLTSTQITMSRTNGAPATAPKVSTPAPTINPIQVLQQAEQLWDENENIESVNLLKGLLEYLKSTKFSDQQILVIVHCNLAVCYYKIGFLDEANHQFVSVSSILQDLGLALKSQTNKPTNLPRMMQKLRYNMLLTRIHLQTCILFSQMGNHDRALEFSQISCKIAYNMIYDIQLIQYQHLISLLNKNKSAYAPNQENQLTCEGHENLINNIVVIDHLLNCTKDLRKLYISREKADLLEEEKSLLSKIGKFPTKSSMELLFNFQPDNQACLWIYKNKILDEIQMKFISTDVFDIKQFWTNNQVIEKIVYLTISLYCSSTETRFIEKNKESQDPSEVLDSEHWLSRSLEIAYTFLPHEAPILNQILTVHDRFHGIDKQTIPEDKEIGGFFKVLRPLSKPKSSFTSKNSMCAPIMIRIQAPKISIEVEDEKMLATNMENQQGLKLAVKNFDFANKTIDLENITRNNKIRGGLNSTKKYDMSDFSQSTIKHHNNTKVDFTQNIKNIYASRKIKSVVEHTDRLNLNVGGPSEEMEGQSSKSMKRPQSYDREINKYQERITERKKKSYSLTKKDGRKRSSTSNSTGLKLDGLHMLPNPFKKGEIDEAFDIKGRVSKETTKMGGNIFINNNINLFISKESLDDNKEKPDKVIFQISKRQNFINRRRAHHSNFSRNRSPEFAL